MTDRNWDPAEERKFDAMLESGLPELPPKEIVEEVTPWRGAFNRVLVGIVFGTVTLSFLWLDYILPAIGAVLSLLGYRALRHRDPRLVEEFRYSATAPTLQRARDITVDAIDDFKSGKLDEIYIVYTKIQNALTSEPVMERLLPLDRAHLTPAPKGLGDPRGEVEMFPDAWTVFEQTAPIYMHGMIFGAMTESFCAEQSARMTAMDSATKSAKDMIHDLELEYNRSRQGSITQEITEIIGGAAAVQNNE